MKVATQRTIERDLAMLQKTGIIRHEAKVNVGKWVVIKVSKEKGYPIFFPSLL